MFSKIALPFEAMHSAETCGRTNIFAQKLFKTLLRIEFKTKIAKLCVHISQYLVNTTTQIKGLETSLEIDQH